MTFKMKNLMDHITSNHECVMFACFCFGYLEEEMIQQPSIHRVYGFRFNGCHIWMGNQKKKKNI